MHYKRFLLFILLAHFYPLLQAQSLDDEGFPWTLESSQTEEFLYFYLTFDRNEVNWESERTRLKPGKVKYKYAFENFAVMAIYENGDTLKFFMPSPLWASSWTNGRLNLYRIKNGVIKILLPFNGRIPEVVLMDSGKEIKRLSRKEVAFWVN